MKQAEDLIRLLNLQPHPEGGFYREIHRSDDDLPEESLPERYTGKRSLITSIYYLLKGNDFSAFHRLRSDELWHFHAGEVLEVFILGNDGTLNIRMLGPDPGSGHQFQVMIPRGHWFAARLKDSGSFCLTGCTVAPGFDFSDFELAERSQLLQIFPEHKEYIIQLTRDQVVP
ncbi:MAG: cupin domain-containing protein [Bacteroidetes bacterium]|nr:cupin domain-containing protein [Bacteroidota bacterium]